MTAPIGTKTPPAVVLPEPDQQVRAQQTQSTGTTPAKTTNAATGATITPTTDGMAPRTTTPTVSTTTVAKTAPEKGLLQTRGPTTTAGPLTHSHPLPNLPSGEPLVIKRGETLEQALEGYYRKQGQEGFTASSELTALVREMNGIREGARVPDRITVWDAQGMLAFRAARGLSDGTPAAANNSIPETKLTAQSVNETMNAAIQNGSAVVARAGDTWATFVQREYSNLQLSPEAQAVLATMLQQSNNCQPGADMPPVVVKPDLEGLALLNGGFRKHLPTSGQQPPLDADVQSVATRSGCDPTQVSTRPTAGQVYVPLATDTLSEVTAFAYRGYLQGKMAESPEGAATELLQMMAVVRDLNRGHGSAIVLPSQERMVELMATRKQMLAPSGLRPEGESTDGTRPAGSGPKGAWKKNGALQGQTREQLTATLQQVTSMTEWPAAQRIAGQDQATTEIARAIYESRRFQVPWFAPLLPTYTPSLSFGPSVGSSTAGMGSTLSTSFNLGTTATTSFGLDGPVSPSLTGGAGTFGGLSFGEPVLDTPAPGTTSLGLSLGAGGLYGWPFTSVPFMGVTWSDLDAARLQRLAMGGDSNETSGNLSAVQMAQTQLANVPVEQKPEILARAQEIDDLVTGLRAATVDGAQVLPDGVLVVDRQGSETWAQAVDRIFAGSAVDAATRGRLATALETQHRGDTEVSLDPTALLVQQREYEGGSGVGATAAKAATPTPEPDILDDPYLDEWEGYNSWDDSYDVERYFDKNETYSYVDVPVDVDPAEAPYSTPERMEEYVYKELKRRNVDHDRLTPAQRATISQEARRFVEGLSNTRRGAVDFERVLHDRTVQLNQTLANFETPRTQSTTGASTTAGPRRFQGPTRTGPR